jgi:hypothetical protein
MRSGVLDTLTRIIMLVLAGTVSLSIIGAIAAMSEGGGGPGGFFVERQPAPVPTEPERIEPRDPPQAGGVGRPDSGVADDGEPAPTAASQDSQAAKWLEVIAYLLLAIAGLAALLALIQWRAFAELRRAADAIERLAAGEQPR